ncbi:DUF2309 domain-containing protein [Mariniblastus fucicola]|uniref:Probable inorganic carbon transporter subunit DabA n=1 Tax=Mariniblastus fucicola TaxID=980251 RepID=A0A5B9P3S3_9BACT|nr:DUF2309 domain-containing protein [Mariniblastus fucicola]QEG21058.1 hypothetical protein MFFC18_09100 [Mariniblastus fucicola]
MNSPTTISQPESASAHSPTTARSVLDAIEHVAHLLPSQGPITAFVHHNTLHAFEDLAFDDAVRKGAQLFGCHPYLPESEYRRCVVTGRIRPEDIDAVLLETLGDRADELLGFLGTRFNLYRAILNHDLHDGPSVSVRWVVGDTNALTRYREDAEPGTREQLLAETKRWVMQDLRNVVESNEHREDSNAEGQALIQRTEELFRLFGSKRIESWSDATWESFSLHLLWQICEAGVTQLDCPNHEQNFVRQRDWIFELTGEDADELVHETLIQFCAAFLDQGLSDWPMAHPEEGFLQNFVNLYSQTDWLASPWKQKLAAELRRQQKQGLTSLGSIQDSLQQLNIASNDTDRFIEDTMLALRGFAGMIWQLETRGDRVTRGIPADTLQEFLAVRLILDRLAAEHLVSKIQGFKGSISEFNDWAKRELSSRPNGKKATQQRRAYRIFELAQLLGWHPHTLARLSSNQWQELVDELDSFAGIDRRAVFHLAYERKFRNEILDAVHVHADRVKRLESQKTGVQVRPSFQIVCCIDDREESFRRYLEELEPDCETFGAAGFFAVPMYYRGAADADYLPLCPASVIPEHYVREEVAYSLQRQEQQRSHARRTIGTFARRVHVGSRTFTGGWIGTTVLGSFATFPLVFRVLFPRLTARLKDVIGSLVRPPEVTHLKLERNPAEPPGPEAHQLGLTVDEMAIAVQRLLEDMSATENFAPIFFICGHGSSSLNNPHEAAYNCGACAGGRGGPNARAFAQMANDPRVRKIVADNGINIPDDTIFIGCYHNTCDDNVSYFDLDGIPDSHRPRFESAVEKINLARKHDAHERCRRFASAPLDLDFDEALIHVEGRAEDLSQARPEYNHATNALCFVGRREWSRDLFLDRRAFLQSYEPENDDENCSVLERILQAVIPVCAGINLEYYFSSVDHVGYGAGNKLPHNIVSLIGVMDGAASDLRPGLYCQMIEIHEPMRLLFLIETTPAAMQRIIAANEPIRKLCEGDWVQLAVIKPGSNEIQLYKDKEFVPYKPETAQLPVTPSSFDWYRGWRDNLQFASIGKRFEEESR